MSQVEGTFNPSSAQSGRANVVISQGWTRLYNESAIPLLVTFDDGSAYFLPAWTRRQVCLANASGHITWARLYTPVFLASSSPSSIVVIESMQPSEVATQPQGDLVPMGPRQVSIGTAPGTGEVLDVILFASMSVDMTIFTAQTFPLSAAVLNLSGVSATSPGYLVLGFLDILYGRLVKKDTQSHKEGVWYSVNYSFPGAGATTAIAHTIAPMNYGKSITITAPTGVTITKIRINKAPQDTLYYDLQIAQQVAGTTMVYDLGSRFDGQDGYVNLKDQGSSTGFSLEVTATNANAGSTTVAVEMAGSQIAYDECEFNITYQDWLSNSYSLINGRLGTKENIPLDIIIPIAITDPTQTNFGNLLVSTLSSQLFYNTHETLEASIPAAVTFLTPS